MKHVRISLLLVSFLVIVLLASTVVVAPPAPGTPGASGGMGNTFRTLFDSFYQGFGWFNKIAESLINFMPGSEGDPDVQLAIFWMRFALLILVFSILLVGVRSAFGEGQKGLGVAAFIIALISVIAIPSALLVTITKTYGALVVFGLLAIVIFALLFFRHLFTSRADNSSHPAVWRGGAALITFMGFSIVTAMGQGFKAYEFTLLDVGDTYNVIVTVLMLLLIYDVFKFFSALFRGGLARSGFSTPGAGVGGWFNWARTGITNRLPGGGGTPIGDIGAPGAAGAAETAAHGATERAETEHAAEEHAEHGERIEADITDLTRRMEDTERAVANLNARAEERERAFEEHTKQRATIANQLRRYFTQLHGFLNFEITVRQQYREAPDSEKAELSRNYQAMVEQKKRVLAEVETLLKNPVLVGHEIANLRQLRDELHDLETRAHDFLTKERRLARREAKEAAGLGEEAKGLGYQDIVKMADAIRQSEIRGTELETREVALADQIAKDLTEYHTQASQLEKLEEQLATLVQQSTQANELIREQPQMEVVQRLTLEREIQANIGKIVALFNQQTLLGQHLFIISQRFNRILGEQKQVATELQRIEAYVFRLVKLARLRLAEYRTKP